MDQVLARARSPSSQSVSPTTALRSRPLGPRGPKPNPKGIIPLDLSSRMEEATPAYSSPASTTWSPMSPGFPLALDREGLSECGSTTSRLTGSAVSRGVQTSLPERSVISSDASPVVKVIKKMRTLTPPSPPNFESIPVPWRGMTLEAAQWSLTSEQLQEIVSAAIRASASESFIRLIPLPTQEQDLGRELKRLEAVKSETQAQYRFNMHRRMMLLQSLNALSFAQSADSSDAEALANLTIQLAEVTAACDRLMEKLLLVSDQRAQIQRLQDVHTASALAMALRKLNTSYGRRVAELKEARHSISELQAELDEAWQVAQEMAQEMDDLDNFDLSFCDDELPEDTSAVIGDGYTEHSVQMAEVVEITGTAVATKATYANVPTTGEAQVADRAGRVMAARRRSGRASKASLRLPQKPASIASGEQGQGQGSAALRRARSRSRSTRRPTITSDQDVPEVPTIQIDTAGLKDSFLELAETRPGSPLSASASPQVPPPVPQILTIDSTSKRDTLEVHAPLATPSALSPGTPGFDRTIIPPLHELGSSRDDVSHPTSHEQQTTTRRVQSLQPHTFPAPGSGLVSPALRRANSDQQKINWSLPDSWKPKPKTRRMSVPIKTPDEPLPSRPPTRSGWSVTSQPVPEGAEEEEKS